MVRPRVACGAGGASGHLYTNASEEEYAVWFRCFRPCGPTAPLPRPNSRGLAPPVECGAWQAVGPVAWCGRTAHFDENASGCADLGSTPIKRRSMLARVDVLAHGVWAVGPGTSRHRRYKRAEVLQSIIVRVDRHARNQAGWSGQVGAHWEARGRRWYIRAAMRQWRVWRRHRPPPFKRKGERPGDSDAKSQAASRKTVVAGRRNNGTTENGSKQEGPERKREAKRQQ